MGYGRGSVTQVRTRSGPRYRVRIPDGKGSYISAGTYASREEAERMRDACLEERDGAGGLAQTVEEYGQRVLDRWELAGRRSIRAERSRWRSLVSRAPWIDSPVDAVTRSAVRDWTRSLVESGGMRSDGSGRLVPTGRPITRQTIVHALGLVRRVLAEAVEDGIIESNPAAGVRAPQTEEADDRWTYLRQHEIDRLLSSPLLPDEQRAVFTVAIFAGLREGELAGLRWEDVELDEGHPHLRVRTSWERAPKTRRSARVVDLLDPARHALLRWHAAQGHPRSGPVWPAPGGGVYAEGYRWQWEDKRTERFCYFGWRRRCGITRHVRFHDLRHTCASHLVMGTWGRAWSLSEVRDFMGHSSTKVTERYSHLAPGHLRAAARATRGGGPTGSGGAPRPDADLTPAPSPPSANSPESLALPAGFEPATNGLGTNRAPAESLENPPSSQVSVRFATDLLERAARGDTIPDELITALASAVVSSEPVRLALQLAAGDASDPHRVRQALRLARAVGGGVAASDDEAADG